MASNSFGQIFKITSFGESHGPAIGVVIDGCPAGLDIDLKDIQKELDRRKPGDKLSSSRKEEDKAEILSGIFEGKTLGTPIAILIKNCDANSLHYDLIKDLYRPGHADFSYDIKYGFRDYRGGGRASARETVARVAAGAIAKKLLNKVGIKIESTITQIGKITLKKLDLKIIELEIEKIRKEKDSLGGIVQITAKNVPAGLGEPVFDKLSADLAKAFVSIPAVKGFEIGDGFESASKKASENNDEIINMNGKIRTKTNHAGGIVGGISNGEDIVVKVAFKAPSSIPKKQKTVDKNGKTTEIEVLGRHDPFVCLRALPICEAMMALTLADHYLRNKVSTI